MLNKLSERGLALSHYCVPADCSYTTVPSRSLCDSLLNHFFNKLSVLHTLLLILTRGLHPAPAPMEAALNVTARATQVLVRGPGLQAHSDLSSEL
jgi:hypothetical protein